MRAPIRPISSDAKQVMEDYQKDKAKKYGMNYIEPTQPKWFVSYPYMVAIMAVLQVLTALYNRHFVTFFGFDISFGSLYLFPWVIFIFQIATECYGWQYARQIVWSNFLVNGVMTVVTFIAKYVEYSPLNHLAMKSAYMTLVDTMWVACAMSWIVIFLSDYVTSVLTAWSRFQWGGKFLILRTIILNLVSESILLSSSFVILPFNGYSFASTIHIVYNILIARLLISLMLLPLVRLIIWVIQHKIEHVVVFDVNAKFTPFKLNINHADTVYFNTDGWDKIESGKVDVKKMAEYYSNGILEQQYQKLEDNINNRK